MKFFPKKFKVPYAKKQLMQQLDGSCYSWVCFRNKNPIKVENSL